MGDNRAEYGTARVTTLVVEWDDWNDPDRDWGYHLRMGGIDAYEVTVLSQSEAAVSDESETPSDAHQRPTRAGVGRLVDARRSEVLVWLGVVREAGQGEVAPLAHPPSRGCSQRAFVERQPARRVLPAEVDVIDEAGIVEHLSWAESVAVASFRPTTWCGHDDLRAYAAEATVLLANSYDGRGTFRGFIHQRLRFTIIDLLRRDFGRRWRSATVTKSIEEDCARMGRADPALGGSANHEPAYLAYDPHVEDDVVDRIYARQVADALDHEDPSDWVVAETAKGRTLEEVGRQLGVTESRACQLRTAARRRLKARLAY